MKITNFGMPRMAKNYIDLESINDISNKLRESYVKIDEDTISIYMKDDSDLGNIMRLIKEKCEFITRGGGKYRVYEYELGYSELENSGHIFLITIDDKDYYCIIQSICNIENGDLHINFRII